jgi:hypothetical protein
MVQQCRGRKRFAWPFGRQAAAGIILILGLSSCAVGRMGMAKRVGENARLVEEVKAFGSTLGIVPTEALSRTTEERPPLSMLWFWMQRDGTLALHAPIDIRMAIGFSTAKENVHLEQVYQVARYSVYYRQGNEFADARSVATAGFAEEAILRRVKVILHEDLHGDENFALPWEVEESIVTPLGSLAVVEFFRRQGDRETAQLARASLEEEIEYARELNALVAQAEELFKTLAIEEAKRRILNLIPSYPLYDRHFQGQIADQHPPTVLEAKLSHDLAYYRYFDQIAGLAKQVSDLKTLIDDLKSIPSGTSPEDVQSYLQQLKTRYSQSTI